MNTNYKRISLSERVYIEESLNNGVSARNIAAHLGRSNSSICDEVKTNKTFAIGIEKGQQANINASKFKGTKICPKLQR